MLTVARALLRRLVVLALVALAVGLYYRSHQSAAARPGVANLLANLEEIRRALNRPY